MRLKLEPIGHLIEAAHSAAGHEHYFSSAISTKSFGLSSPLTNREREVVRLIAEGYSSKMIAKSLGIGAKTVETHRLNIMRKLGCSRCADLVRYAVRHEIIDPAV